MSYQFGSSDKIHIAAAGDTLRAFFETHGNETTSKFARGHLVTSSLLGSQTCRILQDYGLLEVEGDYVRSLFDVTFFDGLVILSDRRDLQDAERVFSPYMDESVLLPIWAVQDHAPGIALDLCTGSGIGAIIAARAGAKHTFASDVSDRARKLCEINVSLNGLASAVEYVHSDIFTAFDNQHFDLILCNPPFEPAPSSFQDFAYGNGGPFGTRIIEKLFDGVEAHLSVGGAFYCVAMSLVESSSNRVWNLLRSKIENRNVGMEKIYDGPSLDLEEYCRVLTPGIDANDWVEDLFANSYTGIDYFAFRIGGDKMNFDALEHAKSQLRAYRGQHDWDAYCWSMPMRMLRSSTGLLRSSQA